MWKKKKQRIIVALQIKLYALGLRGGIEDWIKSE